MRYLIELYSVIILIIINMKVKKIKKKYLDYYNMYIIVFSDQDSDRNDQILSSMLTAFEVQYTSNYDNESYYYYRN